jgi:uncharacterized glyoxalase superfamily protein PhnB/catechol 2,3-dioxygenase-like lactoylglutathione lyase family enzyme
MSAIDSLVLEVDNLKAAEVFHAALDLDAPVSLATSDAPTTGFRGYTLSILVPRVSVVDSFLDAALGAGATVLKPARKSLWGYGGVVQAPDGAIWKVATSSKKETGPARDVDDLVLLLGVADVKASKRFYVEHGLAVGKSFGSKYVEFDLPGSPVKLALYGRRAAAKDAGVTPEGTGSHRLVVTSDAGRFTDPDGFAWEATSAGEHDRSEAGGGATPTASPR